MNVGDLNYSNNLLHLTVIVTVRFLSPMCVYAFIFILSQDFFFSFKLWFPFLVFIYVVFQYMYTLFTFVLSVHNVTTNVILQTTFSLVLLACALACCSGQAISKSSLVYVFILLLVHDYFNIHNYSVFPVFISTIRYKIRSIYVFEKRHSYYVT